MIGALLSAIAAACGPCHDAVLKADPAHAALVAKHAGSTCVSCHRGVETATSSVAAHASKGPDAYLDRFHAEASCVGCHVRGAPVWIRGMQQYLALGCPLCHQGLGLGHVDAFGPPLGAIGLRDPAYIEDVLDKPSHFFPKTVMPSYASLAPAHRLSLAVYLRSLRGKALPAVSESANATCGSCHSAGAAKKGPPHKCLGIDPKEMTCARCHGGSVPASKNECLYIGQRLPECRGCHEVKR